MGDVIVFSRTGKTPDELLEEAKGKLDRVAIIGVTTDMHEYNEKSDLPMLHFWDAMRFAYGLLKNHDEE